jgi:hypothetical protein
MTGSFAVVDAGAEQTLARLISAHNPGNARLQVHHNSPAVPEDSS